MDKDKIVSLKEYAEKLKEYSEKMRLDRWINRFDKWATIFHSIKFNVVVEGILTIYTDTINKVVVELKTPTTTIQIMRADQLTIDADTLLNALKQHIDVIIGEFVADLTNFIIETNDRLIDVFETINKAEEIIEEYENDP